MEKLVGIAIIGEIIFINLIYARKNIRIFHFFPYIWLAVVFFCGWVFFKVFSVVPILIVCVCVVLFHYIAVKAPLDSG